MGKINKTRINFRALDNLIKDLRRNVSIRIGIIGEKAHQIHKGTNLTNAELGAVHEFGATINHPGGTPYIIKEDGMAQFVPKDKGQGLPKTKPHQIIIPTRSFLRVPLLSPEGKKAIREQVKANSTFKKILDNLGQRELNAIAYKTNIDSIMGVFARTLASAAENRVKTAFKKDLIKPPTTQKSKQNRKYNPNNPTLIDTGQLEESITSEIKIK